MKNFKLLICLLVIICSTTSAQKFYISTATGYGFPLASNIFIESNSVAGTTKFNVKNLNLGEGWTFGIKGGYFLNQNTGFEIELSDRLYDKSFEYNSEFTKDKARYSMNMGQISPCLFMMTKPARFRLYSKVGLNVGIAGILYEEYSSFTSIPTSEGPIETSSESKIKKSGGIAFGTTGAIGIVYRVSGRFGINLEAKGSAQSWAPTKGELVKNIYNGRDILPETPSNIKEVNYVKEGTFSENSSEQPLTRYSMSAISINIGLQFLLGRMEEEPDSSDKTKMTKPE